MNKNYYMCLNCGKESTKLKEGNCAYCGSKNVAEEISNNNSLEEIIMNQDREIQNLRQINEEHRKENGILRIEVSARETCYLELEAKIKKVVKEIDNLQQDLFGHEEYLNWIVAELERIKNKLLDKGE